MKTLNSFADMALTLVEREVAMAEALHAGLKKVAARVEKTAKAEIGRYQAEVGPFPAWPALADSTEERKAALGYPADAPLFATGEMKDSVEHQVEGLEAAIGTPDPKMVYHEFGTSRMPARPVFGPAGFRNRDTIRKLVGAAAVAGIIGEEQIHAALGYDFETED